ncbi:MAG: hypothetical protein QOF64_1732 [Candidatus Binatota bacterium]|jgi:hypothetical protein|nr:hypothetical protein [Candidatus Binatota bacterium]
MTIGQLVEVFENVTQIRSQENVSPLSVPVILSAQTELPLGALLSMRKRFI